MSKFNIITADTNEELKRIPLPNIKSSDESLLNILFNNCYFKIALGDKITLDERYNKFFYSESLKLLMMFSKNISYDDVLEYLKSKAVEFNTISFLDKCRDYPEGKAPEIWFARDKEDLSAIVVRKKRPNRGAKYFPNISGGLSLVYGNNADTVMPVEGLNFDGVIKYDDCIVLLVDGADHIEFKKSEIMSALKEQGVGCKIIHGNHIRGSKPNQMIKKK